MHSGGPPQPAGSLADSEAGCPDRLAERRDDGDLPFGAASREGPANDPSINAGPILQLATMRRNEKPLRAAPTGAAA